MKTREKALYIIILLLFFSIILIRVFYLIDYPGINDLDEAWHAINAYEMYKSNLWAINTYMGDADYFNSKPPLSLIPIIALFHINGGASFFLLKLPSAIAGIMILIILGLFLYKKQKSDHVNDPLRTVAIFFVSYLTMDKLYDFHMFRTGNLDSIYNLFLILGLICLYCAQDKIKWLIPFGVNMGMAFLCKSFNVAAIIFASLFCIPFLDKKKKWRHILYSFLSATLVVFPWAVKRFAFDKMNFFYAMLGEGDDKVTWFTLDGIYQIRNALTFRILFITIVLHATILFIQEKHNAFSEIKRLTRKNIIFWIWLVMPILFYSLAGTVNDWYIYPSFILAAVLIAIYANDMICRLCFSVTGKSMAIMLLSLFMILTIANAKSQIDKYALAGKGGGDSNQFRDDIIELIEKNGEKYRGSDLYMQDYYFYDYDRNRVVDVLFCHTLVYARYMYDLTPQKGGIDAWENSEDGVLVINKGLWDSYSHRLSGHVELQDNFYLWFSKEYY